MAAAALLGATAAPSAAADRAALTSLRQAVDAQGGEGALRAIATVEWHAQGYRNMLEQSERPDGPYIPEYRDVAETHDQRGGRLRMMVSVTVDPDFEGTSGIVSDGSVAARISAGGLAPADPQTVESSRERLALSPERLLLTALDALDVRSAGTTVLQSVPQDVIAFSYDGAPARLYLNAFTHLPTALDYSGPLAREDYWRFRGDATMRIYFSSWRPGDGVRMPMEWDIYRAGLHDSTYSIKSLVLNGTPAKDAFDIPDRVRAAFAKYAAVQMPPALAPAADVAPGVKLIPGPWNVLLIGQDDGVVVIEAPISSRYSELVLDQARRLFPGVPVKALVTTSDAWPHIGGLRPYVARGIPIYCLGINQPALRGLASASFASRPDALQRSRRRPKFVPVNARRELGTGANRLLLLPIRGESTERQMAVFIPGSGLLYASDAFQPYKGSYQPGLAVDEVVALTAKEHLEPHSFVLMHQGAMAWDKLLASASLPASFPEERR